MNIVAQLVKILKSQRSILEREAEIQLFLTQLVTTLVSEAFESLDKELSLPYLLEGYQVDKRAKRQLTFSFGTVIYHRRKLVAAKRESIYPLDTCLWLSPRQQFSKALTNQLAQVATLGVYRKSATAINLCSPFSVSHQTLRSLTFDLGKEIDAAQTFDLGHESEADKNKPVPILYVEGDAFCVKQKGGGLLYFHRFQVCEGRKRIGKQKRQALIAYHDFIDLDRKKAFAQLQEYLYRTYDMEKVILVSNSDNGSGYGASVFRSLCLSKRLIHEHFIDRYHVNRKVAECLSFAPKVFVKDFQKRLFAYDRQVLQTLLDSAESLCETEKEEEAVRRLESYLKRNWIYLKPFEKRQTLKGFSAVIGTCESHHRPYTYRMKKQGKYWSARGGLAMVKLLSAQGNQEIAFYSHFDFRPAVIPEFPGLSVQKVLSEGTKTSRLNERFLQNIPNPKFRLAVNHLLDHRHTL